MNLNYSITVIFLFKIINYNYSLLSNCNINCNRKNYYNFPIAGLWQKQQKKRNEILI